jgi:Protein of unknown function (DUF1549)/Protein of unknown function (DUF1553)/Planctomycete cytochrome C
MSAAQAANEMGPALKPPASSAVERQQLEFFEANIRPVLVDTCGECHADDAEGDLRTDSRAALLKGGETGPAIVPGDPEKSLLIHAIRRDEGFPKMPKRKAKLPDATIAAFVEWVKQGAPWPAENPAAVKPAAGPRPYTITAEQRAWWAFQPLAHPAPPAVRNAEWAKTDIDRFILARLEREGLQPVKAADRRTLLRRATLDLTGLPPTAEEIDAFVADTAPDAYARVVDRLLASPRYGEAWGRHWLDVARYAEDDPRSLDPVNRGFSPYPNAYLYRDWVVKAFNDDMPYDQFVKAQLAADQLDEKTRVRMLPALGFLGVGPWYYDNGSVEVTRADERHDRVDVVSRGFLGLTVACARCHDHKYDPIPQRDYYSLAGVFLNSPYREYPLAPASVDGDPAPFSKGSGRHELADAIVQEPLAMRVIVNRVWKWHFGTGLVNSASNFGKIGDPPSNPELLEHLAAWFVENGRSIKKLQRQILLSAAYQSSADDSPAAFAKDSGNRWYWRANRRRMTAEEVRDSALFVAGALDEKMGGPSEELTPSATRRTLYARISRYKLDSFLQLFDFPAPTISAEQRFSTNVPLQRLFLMNSDFMQQQAERLARKLETEADNSSRIKKAYRTLFGREPKPEELTAGLEYLAAEPLRAYEERKAAEAKKTDAEKAKEAKAAKAAKQEPKMGEGMMAGVTAPGGADAKDKKEMLPVTPLGRYLKVLLSSSEFLFVD